MRIGKRSFASRKRKIAGLCAFVLAGVIGVGAYAFTASNTVEPVRAGAGSAKISGYTVKEPENWTFSETGEDMTKVTFELSEEATDVAAALSEGPPITADWKDCGATAAKKVTCTFAAPVEDVKGDKLSVAAVSHGTVTIE